MRTLLGFTVIGVGGGLLVRFVTLLDCLCGYVTPWDFALVFLVIVGGFAVMLPDKEE